MKVGIIQMPVSADKEENLIYARREILKAAELGAQVVVLPEMFCTPYENRAFTEYAECEGGRIYSTMRDTARDAGVYLVAGSFPERCGNDIYNSSYVFSPECERHIAHFRKMHLFDIDVKGGQSFRESDTLSAGNSLAVFDTPWGRCGVCICFDIRFPELARLYALSGVKVLFVPAAFNMTTGPAHWELTMRARALDNQLCVVACAPARDNNASYVSYANSLVASAWGDIKYRAGEGAETLVCDLDMQEAEKIRAELPLLSARRCDLYDLKFKY